MADPVDRFAHLCAELNATCRGERGTIEPGHAVAIRDRILPKLVDIRQRCSAERGGQPLHPREVSELWDLFTDITGIPETS